MTEKRIGFGGDHYAKVKIEPIEYIQANSLNFCEGNVVKYITRHRYKNGLEDLKKAMDYLAREIENTYGVKVNFDFKSEKISSVWQFNPEGVRPLSKMDGLDQIKVVVDEYVPKATDLSDPTPYNVEDFPYGAVYRKKESK